MSRYIYILINGSHVLCNGGSTINLVNSQIGNHLEYKSRSTYESNNIDWALLNVDTFFLIKVEIL